MPREIIDKIKLPKIRITYPTEFITLEINDPYRIFGSTNNIDRPEITNTIYPIIEIVKKTEAAIVVVF